MNVQPNSIQELHTRVTAIEKRNANVEKDKAWETSVTRKILVMVFTYLSIGLYMHSIDIENPWVNAVVPTVGFYLSTLTLPYFKALWLRYVHKQ